MSIQNPHKYYTKYTLLWEKVRDCLDGEDQIKDQGEVYLPKPSAQNVAQYNAYRVRASFYAVAERTLRGMTGMIFRNDPVIVMPTALEPWLVSATNEGMSLQMFIEEVTREVMSMGRYGVLLDLPATTTTVGTVPYLVPYSAENISDWEETTIEGKKVVTRIVLRDDMMGAEKVTSLIELQLIDGVYSIQRYQTSLVENVPTTTRVGEQVTPLINGAPLDYIPFVFFNPYDLRPEVSKPPFIDLCNMNLAHYRNSADYEHALFQTAQPTPWIAGQLDEKTKPSTIGGGTIWYLPEDAKAGMLEFTGKGLDAQRVAMQDKEDRMASLGARMIKDSSRVQEKAETARLRARGETSLVMDTLQTVETGINRLMRWSADWLGSTGDVSLRLNKDFVDAKIDANMLMAIVKSWQSGAISRDTMHANLQQGEVMAMDVTPDDEKDKIDDEGEFIPGETVSLGGASVDIVPETAPNEGKTSPNTQPKEV